MEEIKNKPTEIIEEVKTSPTRDEILAISREENKNGDEMEKDTYKIAIQIAYSLGLLLIGIIMLVSSILNRGLPTELMIVYMGMTGTSGLFCGIRITKNKKLFLTSGVLCLIACVLFIVLWILELCGVA